MEKITKENEILKIGEEVWDDEEDTSSNLESGTTETINIKIKDIIKGFKDSEEEGTWTYDGKLNIRPAFQREFVYDIDAQERVIDSILKGYPLSLIYWSVNEDGTFEMIDGQQRTLSIINFAKSKTKVKIGDHKYDFESLDEKLQERFLDYELNIVKFTGTKNQKLEYFNLINTTQNKLNNQELLNAAYYGSFVTHARKAFSNKKSEFFVEAGAGGNWTNYLIKPGQTIDIKRQFILEKVLGWVAKGKSNIKSYMENHQSDQNADSLIGEVKDILTWAKNTFVPTSADYHNFMGNVNWSEAYYTNNELDETNQLNSKSATQNAKLIKTLLEDPSINNEEGIIMYLITRDEKHLNNRSFSTVDKKTKYKEQNKKCANPNCPNKDKTFEYNDMEGDHVVPWSKGGKTEYNNLQMLCKPCNGGKSNITPIEDFNKLV